MKNLFISSLALSLLLVACAKSTGGSSSTDSEAVVLPNQTISGYASKNIDFFSASSPTAAIIFLHGGGGHKEALENDFNIKSDTTTTNYSLTSDGNAWLLKEKVLAVFPQGDTIAGYNAWTWSNYVMDSGMDDVAFLRALVAQIKANPKYQSVTKFYLVGHSNGGMMAQRMWCESPETFDGYGSIAGPASVHLDPTLVASGTNHPCAPNSVKPFISILGSSDRVLQTTGNMGASVWTTNPALHIGNPPTWIDNTPQLMNEVSFYAKKTLLRCGVSPSTASVSGLFTTYSDCGDSLRLVVVAQAAGVGGDHCLVRLSGPCTTTLKGDTNLDYRQTLIDFLKKY